MALPPTEQKIMDYLHREVFDPILTSTTASQKLKSGVSRTIYRMERLPAQSMLRYYWNSMISDGRAFAKLMKAEGFTRFEETIDEFMDLFGYLLDPRKHRI